MICQALRGAGEPLSSPQPGTHYARIGKTCSGTGPVASRRFPGRMPGAGRRESGARSGSTSTRHGPLAPLRSNRRGSKRAQSRAAAVAGDDKDFHSAAPSLGSRSRRESGERTNRFMCHSPRSPEPAGRTPGPVRTLVTLPPVHGSRETAWASHSPLPFPHFRSRPLPEFAGTWLFFPHPTAGQSREAPALSKGTSPGRKPAR